MRSAAIVACVLMLVTAITDIAHATDKAKLDALLKRYAVDVADLAPATRKPFSPKSACVCSPANNFPGILVYSPATQSIGCGIVTFNADGSLFGLDVTCSDFAVLGK